MVTMKIDSTGVDPNKSNGFEPYEGPLPKPGTYAAVISSCKIRISQAGNPYFNVLFEFANQVDSEKQEFKGYPLWDKIVPGESDIQKERVGKFSNAICGKVKANVDHDEVTDGGKVNKVGGKDPVGTKVKVVVSRGSYNGEPIIEMRDLFPWPKDTPWPASAPEGSEDEDDVEVEDEDDIPEEDDLSEDGDEDEADDEEDDEAEDDEEEGDEEDEEDEETDAERRSELEALDRAGLKVICKEHEIKVLKRHTDEDLVEAILNVEFGEDDEPPF